MNVLPRTKGWWLRVVPQKCAAILATLDKKIFHLFLGCLEQELLMAEPLSSHYRTTLYILHSRVLGPRHRPGATSRRYATLCWGWGREGERAAGKALALTCCVTLCAACNGNHGCRWGSDVSMPADKCRGGRRLRRYPKEVIPVISQCDHGIATNGLGWCGQSGQSGFLAASLPQYWRPWLTQNTSRLYVIVIMGNPWLAAPCSCYLYAFPQI
jgi:hypothetical protein